MDKEHYMAFFTQFENWPLLIWIGITITILLLVFRPFKKIFVFIFTFVIAVFAVMWAISDPNYESIIAAISSIMALLIIEFKKEPSTNKEQLEVQVRYAFKQDRWNLKEPMQKWGIIFVITNNGPSEILFEKLKVTFVFKERPEDFWSDVEDLLDKRRYSLQISIFPHLPPGSYSSTKPYLRDFVIGSEKNYFEVKIFNWETMDPINISPLQHYRGPAPGKKEMWLLYGLFPEPMAERMAKHKIYLHAIDTAFYTDKAKISVTKIFSKVGSFPVDVQERIDSIRPFSPPFSQ